MTVFRSTYVEIISSICLSVSPTSSRHASSLVLFATAVLTLKPIWSAVVFSAAISFWISFKLPAGRSIEFFCAVISWIDFHSFWVDEDKDALYSAGGGATRRNTSGTGSNFVGNELDIATKVILDVHTTVLIGYSHMWPGGFIDKTGDGSGDQASLIYGQIEYKF